LTRIVTYGNCQADALACLLRRVLPASRYSLSFYSNNARTGNLRPEQEILGALREADLLIYQPPTKNSALSEASIRATVRSADAAVSFPYLFNSGICGLSHSLESRQHSYGLIFGEETIIGRLEQGASVRAVIDEYIEGSLDFGLPERFERCLVELERREKSTAIVLSGHIRRNYRHRRQFLSHNHPTTDLLVALCEQLRALTALQIDLAALRRIEDESAAWLGPGGRFRAPVSPHDATILGTSSATIPTGSTGARPSSARSLPNRGGPRGSTGGRASSSRSPPNRRGSRSGIAAAPGISCDFARRAVSRAGGVRDDRIQPSARQMTAHCVAAKKSPFCKE
jgi:hypothetical protein